MQKGVLLLTAALFLGLPQAAAAEDGELIINGVTGVTTSEGDLRIYADLQYDYPGTRLTAELDGRSVTLDEVQDEANEIRWTGLLPMQGSAPGTKTLLLHAEDSYGSRTDSSFNIPYTPAVRPHISIESPAPYAVIQDTLQIRAAVSKPDAHPLLKAELYRSGGELLSVLAENPDTLELDADVSPYAGEELTLLLSSTDEAGAWSEERRTLYVESPAALQPVLTVSGEIVDASDRHILYVSRDGKLILRERDSDTETVVYDRYLRATSGQRLIAGGVLFAADQPDFPQWKRLYWWKDGQLQNLADHSFVRDTRLNHTEGDWIAFTQDDGISRTLNLATGETGCGFYPPTGGAAAGADGSCAGVYSEHNEANGSVASEVTYRNAAGEERIIHSSSALYSGTFFSGNTLYAYSRNQVDRLSGSGSSFETVFRCCTSGHTGLTYQAEGGWLAYAQQELSGRYTVTLTDPSGSSRVLADSDFPPRIDRLSADGRLAYAVGGRTFLYTPGDEQPVPVSSGNGRSYALQDGWYRSIGGTLFSLQETAPAEGPRWPAGTALTVTDAAYSAVTLQWPAALSDQPVSAYRIYAHDTIQSGDRLLQTVSATDNTYRIEGLTAGWTYTFSIEAVDSVDRVTRDRPAVTFTPPQPESSLLGMQFSSAELTPGGEVTWTLRADELAAGMRGFILQLAYDPEQLRLVEARLHPEYTFGPGADVPRLSTATPSPGRIDLTSYSWRDTLKSDSAGLVTLKFAIKPEAEGSASFRVLKDSFLNYPYGARFVETEQQMTLPIQPAGLEQQQPAAGEPSGAE